MLRLSSYAPLAVYELGALTAEITPIKLIAGMLLILFALVEWHGYAEKLPMARRQLALCGAFSGFFGGLSGHQGAFRSVVLLHAGLDTRAFAATNAVIATLVDLTRLAMYGLNFGLVTAEIDLAVLVTATLAAFAGVMAGYAGIHKVTIGALQKVVAMMLLVLGLLLAAGVV